MQKKVILSALVFLELLAGSVFLIVYYKHQQAQKMTQGAQKVALIDKSTVIEKEDQELNYYYEMEPNTTIQNDIYWLENDPTYLINSDGLNDEKNYAVIKPEGVFRILTLGDSYTMGENVNTWESWPSLLEEELNKNFNCSNSSYEVINLGMRGYDIPYLVERFKRLGLKYDPDLIIWYESSSGFSRYLEYLLPLVGDCDNPKYEVDISELKLNNEKIYTCWHEAQKEMSAKYSQDDISNKITTSLESFYTMVDPSKVIYVVAEKGIVNEADRLLLKDWQSRFSNANFEINMPPLLGDQLLLDGHPSPSGHQAIADYLISILKEKWGNKLKWCFST